MSPFDSAKSSKDHLGFKNFEKTCSGIRDVRNHLIEHPTAGAANPHWVYGDDLEHGPAIKWSVAIPKPSADSSKPTPLDPGLYVNAAQMLDALNRRLDQVQSPPSTNF